MRTFVFTAICLLVVGCNSKPAEESATPPAAEQPAAAPAQPAATPAPAQPAPGDDPAAMMQQRMQAIQAAMQAASEVEGKNDCDTAYEGMRVMMEKIRETIPEANKPLPAKDSFAKVCTSLPKKIQKCMVVKYAMANREECQKVQQGMDPKHRKKLDDLLAEAEAKAAPATPAADAPAPDKAADAVKEAADKAVDTAAGTVKEAADKATDKAAGAAKSAADAVKGAAPNAPAAP